VTVVIGHCCTGDAEHRWAAGLATASTMGGFLHVLLVLAVIVVLARIIMGRRVV